MIMVYTTSSSYSLSLSLPLGENAIIIISGANNLLTESDVAAADIIISRAKVLICQLEILPETTLCAMRLAKKNGQFAIIQ